MRKKSLAPTIVMLAMALIAALLIASATNDAAGLCAFFVTAILLHYLTN